MEHRNSIHPEPEGTNRVTFKFGSSFRESREKGRTNRGRRRKSYGDVTSTASSTSSPVSLAPRNSSLAANDVTLDIDLGLVHEDTTDNVVRSRWCRSSDRRVGTSRDLERPLIGTKKSSKLHSSSLRPLLDSNTVREAASVV